MRIKIVSRVAASFVGLTILSLGSSALAAPVPKAGPLIAAGHGTEAPELPSAIIADDGVVVETVTFDDLQEMAEAADEVDGDGATVQAFACDYSRRYAIQAPNGLAVSAEFGRSGEEYGMLRARGTAIGPWEQFYYCPGGPNATFALRTYSYGLYVSARMNLAGSKYGMLRASSSSIGSWEAFHFERNQFTSYFASAANDRYVAAELGYSSSHSLYGMLRARTEWPKVGNWEYWRWYNAT